LHSDSRASICILITLAGLSLPLEPALACAYCRPSVNAQVYNRDFLPNVLVVILPILCICLVAAIVHSGDKLAAFLHAPKGNRR
jgi:hypothetical protein